jgi:hypothetical protein
MMQEKSVDMLIVGSTTDMPFVRRYRFSLDPVASVDDTDNGGVRGGHGRALGRG